MEHVPNENQPKELWFHYKILRSSELYNQSNYFLLDLAADIQFM